MAAAGMSGDQRPRGGAAVCGASVLALATGMSWLAGYPQTTIYVVYTWASLVLGGGFVRRSNRVSTG